MAEPTTITRDKVSNSKSQEVWTSHFRTLKSNREKTGYAVGIDLGTTNSCVSIWLPDKARAKSIRKIVSGLKSSKTAPSVVYLEKGGRIVSVGNDAIKKASEFSESTGCLVSSVKRIIGRNKEDISLLNSLDVYPFDIVERTNVSPEESSIGVKIKDDSALSASVTPEEVSAAIVADLKLRAEEYLKGKVTHAVITVPAYFNERQRSATKTAGELAGLTVLRTLSEPMAAAIAYGLFVAGEKKLTVIDLGGGTFDVSIMSIEENRFETIAIGGDSSLGGDDIDIEIMTFFLDTISIDLSNLQPDEKTSLRMACESAKVLLTENEQSTIVWKNHSVPITRKKLNKLIAIFLAKCKSVINGVLSTARLAPSEIDEVVLVGLPTKMPAFQKMVRQVFLSKDLCTSVSPDLAVSQGAAIQAAIMTGADAYRLKKILMLDALPYSIGLEDYDGSFHAVLPRNSKIPTKIQHRVYTYRDYQPILTVDIYEGEESTAHNNHWIGYHDFIVPGGKSFKAGERSMNITFEVTEDGILVVNAEVPDDETDLCGENSMGEVLRVLGLVGTLIVLVALYAILKILDPLEKDL